MLPHTRLPDRKNQNRSEPDPPYLEDSPLCEYGVYKSREDNAYTSRNRTCLSPEMTAGLLKRSEKYFVITDTNVQCGVCVDMCPCGNYTLDGDSVKTTGDCEFCFACIQNCPQKAIQFAKLEDDPLLSRGELNPDARYGNENISLADLRTASSQH